MKNGLFILFSVSELLFAAVPDKIEIKTYSGEGDKSLVPTINAWIVSHYIRYPFLYVNQGETLPNHLFFDDPQGLILIAEKGGRNIGLLMAMPLSSSLLMDVNYNPALQSEQMRRKGFNPDQILYGGVFLINDEERHNQELIDRFYEAVSDFARKIGKSQICYFTAIREENHPLKPDPFVDPEPWQEGPLSFRKMGVEIEFTWPTLQANGSVKECVNPQALYIAEFQ